MSRKDDDDDAKVALRKERAALVRVARAFADVDQATIAEALDVSVITVKRMERGARDVSIDELHRVADVCRVPRVFMETGFQPFAETNVATREDIDGLRAVFTQGLATLSEALLARDEALRVSHDALARLQSAG